MDNYIVSNFSNFIRFLNILRSIRNFNNKVNNKIIKNSAFSFILLVFLFINLRDSLRKFINFRDYIQILSLRFRNSPPNDINELKNNNIDPCRFAKFNSIQPLVAFLFDIDTKDLKKNDPSIGVFTRNLEDRGVDSLGNNLKKRQYYSAFNLENIPYYDTHINDLFNSIDKDSIENKPLLSSFSNHLVTYFLNIHLGIPNNKQMERPKVVFDYFSDIFKILAIQPSTSVFDIKPNNIYCAVSIKNRAPAVKEYFKKRIDEIKKERPMNKSIAVTNWLTSGFDVDSVQIAAFHNIVAFSQFLNTLSLICDNKINNPDNNYLHRYKNAKSKKEINNLIFDIFKYEVPNKGSLSFDTEINKTVRHLHDDIMKNVDPDNKLYEKNITNFGDSSSSSSKCPFSNSTIDNETVIPCNAEKLIPVFEKPLYTPFGLGYRRCAGELLTYRFTENILKFLNNYNIKQNLNITDDIAVGPRKRAPNNIFIEKI